MSRLRLVLTKKKSMHDRKADTIYELLRARAEHVPEAVAILAPGRARSSLPGTARSG